MKTLTFSDMVCATSFPYDGIDYIVGFVCPNHKDKSTNLHKCPYRQDVDNDEDYLCTCCDECTSDCADDI